MREILDMLYTLSATVEKQNQEIAELKKFIKKSIVVEETTLVIQPKEKETMAFQLVALLLKLAPMTNKSLLSTSSKPCVAALVNNRSRPHVIVDISGCNISIKKRGFAKIRKHIQSSLQSHKQTKAVVIKGMNKNAKKNHCYFLFLSTKRDKKAVQYHIEKWLLSAFPQAFIQMATTYWVKVNNVRKDAIVDPITNNY